MLTSVANGAYEVDTEAIVTRRVTVTGTPSTMPLIDAREASRAFRVKVGNKQLWVTRAIERAIYRE